MDMQRLVYALEEHLEATDAGISDALRRQRRWNRVAAGLAVAAIGFGVADELAAGHGLGMLAGAGLVGLIFFAILAQIASAQAERLTLEREGARLPALRRDDPPDPADLKLMAAGLPLRQSLSLSRARLFRSRLASVLLGALGLASLSLFGLLAADYLSARYADGLDWPQVEDRLYEGFAYGLLAAILIGWSIVRAIDAGGLKRDCERLEVEVELLAQGGGPDAARARKLFLLNEQSLRKYYAANRFNGAAALAIAVVCVLAGLGMTLWTILLVLDAAAEPGRSEALVAGVGVANVVMINVVAAIVLRVHASVSSNVNAFHERLVRTHEAFLSNVIATEIHDPERRDEAFAAIAAVIGRGSGGGSGGGGAAKPPEVPKTG